MNFLLGELFCGPGGLALGAHMAKARKNGTRYAVTSIWANDFDKDTCETYKTNILERKNLRGIVINKDVRKLNIPKLKKIDGLAFGFPCNDYSVVGEKKGMDGVYGPLYSYGIKALQHFQPKWFLSENVGGLRNSNDGSAFKKILSEMKSAGDRLVPHLYKFENYGGPQTRHRIIVIGVRKDLDVEYRVPQIITHVPISSKEAITKPPITKNMPNNELTNQAKQVMERLKFIKPGENAFNADLPSHLRLNVKGATISQIYRRLDPLKPSYTVTGSGGGGTHVYHWEENRALTNRERARLQTFPDDFIFQGSKESVRKQIGMAVPPIAAKIIFEALLKSFAGVKYSYIESNMKSLL